MNDFFIPKVTLEGIGISAASIAGELAVEYISEARNNRKMPNPYNGNVVQTSYKDKSLGTSDLGTNVWSDITFDSVKYTDVNGNEIITDKITFQSILISVSFPRNIVKTAIQGRDGTVKEYIGEGDAVISFRGIITGKNGHYPIDEVLALKKMIKAPVAIPITCTYLKNLDIYSIVFEDRVIEQEEGGYSYQTFSLNAISDIPLELQISGV